MYELLRKYFWEQNLFREFLYTPVYPLPLPAGYHPWIARAASKIKYQIAADVFLVVTPRHVKASAFGFTVFPFVVQAQAFSNSLQSESNHKQ